MSEGVLRKHPVLQHVAMAVSANYISVWRVFTDTWLQNLYLCPRYTKRAGTEFSDSWEKSANGFKVFLSFFLFLFNPQSIAGWTVNEKQGARSTAVVILPSHVSVKNYPWELVWGSCHAPGPDALLFFKPWAFRRPPHCSLQGTFLATAGHQKTVLVLWSSDVSHWKI